MPGRGDGGVASDSRLESVSGGRPDAGRYQVFATLGRGGMAEVFLAVARGPGGFNKLVVLKRASARTWPTRSPFARCSSMKRASRHA